MQHCMHSHILVRVCVRACVCANVHACVHAYMCDIPVCAILNAASITEQIAWIIFRNVMLPRGDAYSSSAMNSKKYLCVAKIILRCIHFNYVLTSIEVIMWIHDVWPVRWFVMRVDREKKQSRANVSWRFRSQTYAKCVRLKLMCIITQNSNAFAYSLQKGCVDSDWCNAALFFVQNSNCWICFAS